MNRFDGVVEKEMSEILDRITFKNDFWVVEKPIPEKVWFQRFGLQLREEDFKQDGVSYRDFFLRDRSEARKATSGFSVVKNDDREFKVDLDVWPFKRDEIAVMVVPGKYFTIQGEHEEKFEDGSICARKFQRYYCLPRGSNSDTIKCSYSNGSLTITVNKEEVSNETRVPQIVPINLVTYRESKVVSSEEQYTPETPTDIREVPITNDDEEVAETTEPPKKVPETNEDLKIDSEEVKKAMDSLVKATIGNEKPKVERCNDNKDQALENEKKALTSDNGK